MYTRVHVHIVDCRGLIGDKYIDIDMFYVDISLLAYVAYMWQLRGILVFVMYMMIT